MLTVDLNCDMGEGAGNDVFIMPYISSANIACGYHAGNEQIIRNTMQLAHAHDVQIGAHPSFEDRSNFGRQEITLSPAEIYALITRQLLFIKDIAASLQRQVLHIKPHGALYNMSARDAVIARSIAQAVKEVDPGLIVFGLSGSHSIKEAAAAGLNTCSEVFADRTYQEDGSLTPRKDAGALIEDPAKAIEQVIQMISTRSVTSLSGKQVPIVAETICIHGDGKQAALFAKNIHHQLHENNIAIQSR